MELQQEARHIIDAVKAGETEIAKEFRTRVLGYLLAAFGLVAGLAWNEAIVSLIEYFFPLSRNTVSAKLLYAAVITVAVIILGSILVKLVAGKQRRS